MEIMDMFHWRRILVVILAVVCVVSTLAIYYVAPLSKIQVEIFNTQLHDTTKVAVFMDGKEMSVVHLEPYTRMNVTYHVAAGTYVFSFAWKNGSDTSMLPYTHYVGFSHAATPPFEVKVGHFDSEGISWNV